MKQRRYRERRRLRRCVVSLEIGESEIDSLIRRGLLAPLDASDHKKLADAIRQCMKGRPE
jgi:hypothetical protein